MIPKVIHYCWFGGSSKPESVERCIESWRKQCPDYKILEWNESNFDVDCIPYCSQAYRVKKWAFVSDYARLKIILDNGGFYLDTDVELIKPLDSLCGLNAFVGFEDTSHINTGLGFGAVAGHHMVEAMERDYHALSFVGGNGKQDLTPCPVRNTAVLSSFGLVPNGSEQEVGGMTILPREYLCPIDFKTNEINITDKTVSIHHFDGTWYRGSQKIKRLIKSAMPVTLLKMVRKNG